MSVPAVYRFMDHDDSLVMTITKTDGRIHVDIADGYTMSDACKLFVSGLENYRQKVLAGQERELA